MVRRANINGQWTILPDWRPAEYQANPGQAKPKGYIRARAQCGLTVEQRRALESARATSGLSMAEILRRCLARGGILS